MEKAFSARKNLILGTKKYPPRVPGKRQGMVFARGWARADGLARTVARFGGCRSVGAYRQADAWWRRVAWARARPARRKARPLRLPGTALGAQLDRYGRAVGGPGGVRFPAFPERI